MKMFIVYTRAIPGKSNTTAPSIVEVDAETIQGMEDPSVMWMRNGEYKARIISPALLHEVRDGSTEKVAPIYYSFNFFPYINQVRLVAKKIVRSEFEFNFHKYGTEFTEEDIQAKFKEIQEILL
jgi:hypothetical protein